MRTIKWHPDERVDIPDLTAMSGLALSEFRRLLSMGVYGLDQVGVFRGFNVEPESPVSSRVVIRMDRTSDAVPARTESLALGAENLGAVLDHGVLIGGRSSDGQLEGPAQVILDFGPQPIGVYVVEMRANVVDGVNENRVFWNPIADAEFVDSVPTRTQPTWEAQIVPAATGGEWIPLAQVNWGGGTISVLNITDGRYLIYEGLAAFGFDAAHQNLIVNDFDRSVQRGNFATTISSAVAAINALQRQVMDLKGQSNFNTWNWYSRVYAPDATGEPVWVKQTKNLRSIDTVTYTVADGVTDHGDFNGTDALNLCFFHIQAQAGSLPHRIKIVIKNRRASGSGGYAFTWNTPIVINDKDIEISQDLGQGETTRTSQNGHRVRGQALISTFAAPAESIMLSLLGRSSLKMRNIVWAKPSVKVSQIWVEGPVDMENCSIEGYDIGWDNFALTCHSDQSTINQCYLSGTVNFGGGDDILHGFGGSVSHTRFENIYLRLRSSVLTSLLTTLEILQGVSQHVSFDHCLFSGRGVAGFTNVGLDVPHGAGMIDARGTQDINWYHCRFDHSGEENGIMLGLLTSGLDVFTTNSRNIEVTNNEFTWFAGSSVHVYQTGVNGLFGTGHHIFCYHDVLTNSVQQTSNIVIRDNNIYGGAFGAFGPSDAGAITLYNPRYCHIENNQFTDWADPQMAGDVFQVYVASSVVSTALAPHDIHFNHNYFGDWTTSATQVSHAFFASAQRLNIHDNHFSRALRSAPGTGPAAPTAGRALHLTDVTYFSIHNNFFFGWRNSSAPTTTHCNVRIDGSLAAGTFSHNFFDSLGGDAVHGDGGSAIFMCRFVANAFGSVLGIGDMVSAFNFSGRTTSNNHFIGNHWTHSGAVKKAIGLGTGTSFTVHTNHFRDGDIEHDTLGGGALASAFGYATPLANYLGGGGYI